jgi:hypothetical protein
MHHMQKVVYEYDIVIKERNGNMSRKCEMFSTLGATGGQKNNDGVTL